MWVISKVRHYLDRKSLMLIYNSLFESRLRYAILAWGTASESDLSKVKVLQNRVARFITFSSFTARAAHIYDKLEVLPLENLLFLQRTVFMHNLHYKNLPYALSSYCHQPKHNFSTRYGTNLNYFVSSATTVRSQNSIKYTGPKAWCDVPKKLKEIAFRKPFSKKMKAHILDTLLDKHKDLPTDTFKLQNPNQSDTSRQDSFSELRAIFDNDDENFVFYGFETIELAALFADSNNESLEFLGFEGDSDINNLFEESLSAEEFLGF